MRVGLVGVGRIGVLHAENLRELPQVEQLVVADADPGRARAIAEKLGLRAADSVDELIESKPDGLIIAAATPAHTELVTKAAQAKITTFCEKPLAPTVEGTKDVIKQADDAGIKLQLGFQRRFDPGYQQARERVQSGELGFLHTVIATTMDAAPPHADYIPTSGGIFRDCAVHDFDIVRWTTGREIVEVYATGANKGADFFKQAGDVDTGQVLVTLDDGTLGTIAVTRYNGAGYDVRLEAHGEKGMVAVGLDDRAPLRSTEAEALWPAGPAYQTFSERFAIAYAEELKAFVDLIANGGEPKATARDALEALYLAEAAEKSRKERRPVAVEEVRV